MSSTWGEKIKLSIFGESHGAAIGVVLDGLPAGEKIDRSETTFQMLRRAPGRDSTSTARRESDIPEILSGLKDDVTTGSPLCAIIRNHDARSGDYARLDRVPRPGHADYTAWLKYGGHNDFRGGGHFSGRLTAPMVFAGAVCRQILSARGVEIAAHLYSVGNISESAFDPCAVSAEELRQFSRRAFPVVQPESEKKMRDEIEAARHDGDSVGGIVECAASGVPAGTGGPVFGGVENRLASILFGIPAVKGVEFGAGFSAARLRGSRNNDAFYYDGADVKTATNHSGGILGGITTGMPLIFRVALKPTPSIFLEQQTVDLEAHGGTTLVVKGRHDPCVAVRAVPVVESLCAVCLLDMII